MIRISTDELSRDAGHNLLASNRGGAPIIAVVHQELALLPDLTVAENIGLPHARSGLSVHSAERAAKIAHDAIMLIDPHLAATGLFRKASTLTLYESQRGDIHEQPAPL